MKANELSNNDIIALAILEQMESFRKKLESGEMQAGSLDWTVRICEAIVAEYTQFKDRASWEKEI